MGNILEINCKNPCYDTIQNPINTNSRKIFITHLNSNKNLRNLNKNQNPFTISTTRISINPQKTFTHNFSFIKKRKSRFANSSNKELNKSLEEKNKDNIINQINGLNNSYNNLNTYLGGEIYINEEIIKENIIKINKKFTSNLIESLKEIEKIERNFTRKTEYIRSKSKGIDNYLYKKQTIISTENELIVNNEKDELLRTYSVRNIKLQKINSITESLTNSLILDSESISNTPKGYFQVKKKNFSYYGKKIEGKKNGFGIVKWEDGSFLKANFINSKINGYGIFTDTNYDESIFCGEYYDNIVKGYGYYIKNGLKTEGDCWFKNNINGLGIQFNLLNGNIYKGSFLNSKKNGIGCFRWNDGTISYSEFYEDKINGFGIIKYNNDCIYSGEIKDNNFEGFGEFLWNDNKYYCGNYLNGVKNGFGIFVWNFKKLDSYIGFWENGKCNGVGIKIDDINCKIGIWKDGRRINWIKILELDNYLKPFQIKYKKFLENEHKFLSKFIIKLQKGDIFKERDEEYLI